MKVLLAVSLICLLAGCSESSQSVIQSPQSDQSDPQNSEGSGAGDSANGSDDSSDDDSNDDADSGSGESDDDSNDDAGSGSGERDDDSNDDADSGSGKSDDDSNDDADPGSGESDDDSNDDADSGSGESDDDSNDNTGSGSDESDGSDSDDETTMGLWGECSGIAMLGETIRAMPDDHRVNVAYTGAAIAESEDNINTLSDGCASDTDFVDAKRLKTYIDPSQKGLFVWLAQDSGPAILTATPQSYEHRPYGGHPQVIFLQAAAETRAPVFVALYHDTWDIQLSPLDDTAPVKISEIRATPLDQDISEFRKNRFSAVKSFAAANGDIRARVTAELAATFAPPYYHIGEAHWEKNNNCGSLLWVDATWEISQPTLIKDNTMLVNWARASNADIQTAIRDSLDTAPGEWGWQCTPASDELIDQDWVAKTQRAIDGSYTGPELYLYYED